MKSHVLRKVIVVIFVLICSMLFFEAMASAFETDYFFNIFPKTGSDLSSSRVEINIVSPQVILQGREMQMEFETSTSGVYVPVKWSSSNPNVISCTEDGKIKGLIKGKATITAKARNGKSSDSITVYCAKKFEEPETVRIVMPFFLTNRIPSLFYFEKVVLNMGMFFGNGKKVKVLGYYDDYFYAEYQNGEELCRELTWSFFLPNGVGAKEIFSQISFYSIVLKTGETSAEKLTTKYKGNVDWIVNDKNIISFDESTGKITAKNPGIAIITAKVGTTKKKLYGIFSQPMVRT